MSNLEIASPLTLPCGLVIPNRLAKAAMTEQWTDKNKLPHAKLIEAYGAWADGDWGMVLTGNVQVDFAYLGSRDDIAVNDCISPEMQLETWKTWAATTNRNGTPTIVQLNHPGRQSLPGAGTHGFFGKTMAPSAVPVNLGEGFIARASSCLVFGTPREMTQKDIDHVIERFVNGAKLAHEAGFAGAEIHAAHGYLFAQFLSAKTNKRSDAYGGTPRKRAKIVVDTINAMRSAVPKGFCIGIKLNSVDHQSKRELEECIEQLKDITDAGVDFIEISGGTYEDPTMMTGESAGPAKASTAAREAFFIDFANAIRSHFVHVPLMVTGGFRTRGGMESAVRDGACDMVGVGRPAVLNPLLPRTTILNKEVADADANLYARKISAGWMSSLLGIKGIKGAAETVWYVSQIHKIMDLSKIS